MGVNPNWSKWIVASIVSHFQSKLKDDLFVYYENEYRETNKVQDIVEIRVDGPYYSEVSNKVWYIYIEVNLLCQTIKNFEYIYSQQELLGKIQNSFSDIQIFKYGNKPEDDGSAIFCIKLIEKNTKSDRLITSNFGELEPDSKLLQATVEGHYELYTIGD